MQIFRMIQHFSKEGTFSSRLPFLCNCCILMQLNHQPITAIDLNFFHVVADTALLLLQVIGFKLLQIMRNAAAPGFASFASCADRALLWWGACSPLLTEQFSAYLPGLGKPAGRRKVNRAVFCPIFCCSAAPHCSQGKWPQAR